MQAKLSVQVIRASYFVAFLVTIAFFFLQTAAFAQNGPDTQSGLPRYGVFVFSNFCTSEESGDFFGFRITVLRYGDGDHVMVDWSDGPHNQSIASNVEIDPQGLHIGFLVRTRSFPNDPDSYSGTFMEDALLLTYRESNQAHRLPRVHDFSREIGTCS